MKFQEFLEFFDTGGKISFTYEGKDYEFTRVAHGGNEVDVNKRKSHIYVDVYCNGVGLYESQVEEYLDYLEYLKNLHIGRSLEEIINNSLYEEGSLRMSHDMEITTLGDVMNRINVGYDFELFYKDNVFYMCRWGRENSGEDYRIFVYDIDQYSKNIDKEVIVENVKITPNTEDIDSKHKFIMENENLEEYYFFLKNLKIDGIKFTDIIGEKMYTKIHC